EAMSLPKPSGHISIEGVAFVPPGAQEPILRGVTCEILPGDTVGLIGPSASGKTTLARVMVGSWRPTAGHARLDGADVFVWDAADRGRYIGYMPQDVELFDGPVRENIARMGEPDGDAVVAAAQLAGVHDLILHLPDGYETFIGDGGAKLSGGQRQRIALARALYGDPSLVVLDEPNSNLDTEGERALMEAMTELRRRRITTVVVAHRPTILASVDKLIVLNQGRVEMAGPRDEVLEKVAPGSIDAVRRAIAANPDDAAYAPGTGPKTQPQGQPGAAGPSPGGTVSDAAPAPQGSPAAAPVMRIRPGGGAGRAKAPAPEAASTPDSATAAPSTAEPKQQPTPSAPVQAKAPGNRAEPEPSIRVGPAEAEKPAPVDPVAQPVRPVIATPEPAAEPASSAPQPSNADREKAVASLVSKITAESPPVQPTPAPAAAPVRYSASVPEEAPDTNKGSARQAKPKRSLHKSPTTPGRLFPTPVSAMTVDAQGERFTPRQSRKESDNGASRT
ncbi:MAG: ATP-binding cassette domain-containing protein, partial [Alphaproteobacteria bacterium]|nr:ATP-binding cassette domain-containing protein [Alphaproteobacteria bacterium]